MTAATLIRWVLVGVLLWPVLICHVIESSAWGFQDPDFDQLLKIAKRYELPMPPDGSELVLATRGWARYENGRHITIYHPAFLMDPSAAADSQIALLGWEERSANQTSRRPLDRPYSLSQEKAKDDGYLIGLTSPTLMLTVIQMVERGEREQASELWAALKDQGYMTFLSWPESLTGLLDDPEGLLAHCIFQYYFQLSRSSDADLQAIHGHLVELRYDYPFLFTTEPRQGFSIQRNRFVDDLELTINAEVAMTGSIEYLLWKWARSTAKDVHIDGQIHYDWSEDELAMKIFDEGIRAVEGLDELKNDSRITRFERPPFMRAGAKRLRLGELANILLREMCGSQSSSQALEMIKDESLDSQEFFSRAAFTHYFDEPENLIVEINSLPVYVLAQRYPDSLETLVERLTTQLESDLSIFEFCEILAKSGCDDLQKSQLLCKIFDNTSELAHNRAALQNLVGVDESACVQRLLPLLDELPDDVSRAYWKAEEANFVHVVVECDSAEVWDKYLEVVKRSSVGLRMEMMSPMNYFSAGDKNLERRIKFLTEFLDDDELRDKTVNPQRYDGPCAAARHRKIEVRNFAAIKIASLISLDFDSDDFRTGQDWQQFREQVVVELQQRK